MMMKIVIIANEMIFMKCLITLLLASLMVSSRLYAQQCNCADEFKFIKDYIEKNYAGFQDKTSAGNRQAYDKAVKDLSFFATRKDSRDNCRLLRQEFLD